MSTRVFSLPNSLELLITKEILNTAQLESLQDVVHISLPRVLKEIFVNESKEGKTHFIVFQLISNLHC